MPVKFSSFHFRLFMGFFLCLFFLVLVGFLCVCVCICMCVNYWTDCHDNCTLFSSHSGQRDCREWQNKILLIVCQLRSEDQFWTSLFGLGFVFVLPGFVLVVGGWVLVAFFHNCRLCFKLLIIAMAVLILSQVTLKQLFVSPEHKCTYMCCDPEPGCLCHFLLVNTEVGSMVGF